MRLRALPLLAAAVVSAGLLCSCGKSGKYCTLTIKASYSGSDIAGNDLGSGNFEESFTVHKGTALTVGSGSHMKIQEEKNEHTWIELLSIDETGVTYLLRRDITDEGERITAVYGAETKSHDTIIHDGTCCYRKMVFSDFQEK